MKEEQVRQVSQRDSRKVRCPISSLMRPLPAATVNCLPPVLAFLCHSKLSSTNSPSILTHFAPCLLPSVLQPRSVGTTQLSCDEPANHAVRPMGRWKLEWADKRAELSNSVIQLLQSSQCSKKRPSKTMILFNIILRFSTPQQRCAPALFIQIPPYSFCLFILVKIFVYN